MMRENVCEYWHFLVWCAALCEISAPTNKVLPGRPGRFDGKTQCFNSCCTFIWLNPNILSHGLFYYEPVTQFVDSKAAHFEVSCQIRRSQKKYIPFGKKQLFLSCPVFQFFGQNERLYNVYHFMTGGETVTQVINSSFHFS